MKSVNLSKRAPLMTAITLLLSAAVLTGCQQPSGDASPPQSANGKNAAAVHIASNMPMTGDLAIYGVSVREGATMAETDIEKADPTAPKLDFDWQDNTGDPKTAVSVMQQEYLNPVDIYIAGMSPHILAIRDQVAEKKTPFFVYHLYPYLNRSNNSKVNGHNEFRTWVSYKLAADIFLKYVDEIHAKRVAIPFTQIEASSRTYNEIVVPALKKKGVAVFLEPYDVPTKDFKDIAGKIRDFNPDLVILDGFQNNLVGLVRALRPYNLLKQGHNIALYDMMDAGAVLGADEREGIAVVAPTFVTRGDKPEIKAWKERFRQLYKKEPLYTNAFAYDMAEIIHDSSKRLTLPATPDQWDTAVRATHLQGVTGPLQFDQDGNLETPIEIGVFHKGKLVPMSK